MTSEIPVINRSIPSRTLTAQKPGDVVYWLTTGLSDELSIAVNAARDDRWDRFEVCLTECLYRVLHGVLKVRMFPSDFPPSNIQFQPWIQFAS
jgi:hypothetical protein